MSHKATVAWAALFLSAALVPALALDLGLGGVDVSAGSSGGGGTTASATTADSTFSATVGGGTNIANAGTGNVNAAIGTNPGNLITTDTSNGASASVNLGRAAPNGNLNNIINGATGPTGNLLGSLPGGGSGTLNADQVASAFGSLSVNERQLLRTRCAQVIASPASFDAATVALCRIIGRL